MPALFPIVEILFKLDFWKSLYIFQRRALNVNMLVKRPLTLSLFLKIVGKRHTGPCLANMDTSLQYCFWQKNQEQILLTNENRQACNKPPNLSGCNRQSKQ